MYWAQEKSRIEIRPGGTDIFWIATGHEQANTQNKRVIEILCTCAEKPLNFYRNAEEMN